jgi:hypothetical protein
MGRRRSLLPILFWKNGFYADAVSSAYDAKPGI